MAAGNDSLPDEISQAFESVRQSYEGEGEPPHDEASGEVPEHDFRYGEEDYSAAGDEAHGETEQQPVSENQPEPGISKVETVGGDDVEDMQHRRRSVMPRYKIQEVIKRRQIMLIQIAKEERGNKGAAVTTFLSLPGRYCVLMPNTPRGGGISRKIANPQDRKRMKDLIGGLELPPGMSVILRTAGVERTPGEIKRDLDYLLRLWEAIRDLTLQSTAPALVYEEGNLIKRSIRDIYGKDISEILVTGEAGYRQAKDFMRMLMPAHARRVQFYREAVPLFFRFGVESQIDSITNPVAQLRSGGYIVINQTEALVSIDVNSGRSTRERNIEETAYKTNLEAAEEIARQLRLRDMGGLIVIDFIDMEESRHDNAVERRLKDAMRNDRARIQIGRVSAFGLLELSRQRLHPSLLESNFHSCAQCRGTGIVRSLESAAFVALRAIEEEGIKAKSAEIVFHVHPQVAMYVLNNKRRNLSTLEEQYALRIAIEADAELISPDFRIERLRAHAPGFVPPIMTQVLPPIEEEEDPYIEEVAEVEEGFEGSSEVDGEQAKWCASWAKPPTGRRGRGPRSGGDRAERQRENSKRPPLLAAATVKRAKAASPQRQISPISPILPKLCPAQKLGADARAAADAVAAAADAVMAANRAKAKGLKGLKARRSPAKRVAKKIPARICPAKTGPKKRFPIRIHFQSVTISQPGTGAAAPFRCRVGFGAGDGDHNAGRQEPQRAFETAAPPAPPRAFETVNPEPESPKSGWWKRLIE